MFVHIGHLEKVYCRFTVHRDAIKVLKYLPKTQTYMSFCNERNLRIWRLNNKEKKITVLHEFVISPDRKINNVLMINYESQLENSETFRALSDMEQRAKLSDRFMIIFGENPNED